jgi:hypothetical protein
MGPWDKSHGYHHTIAPRLEFQQRIFRRVGKWKTSSAENQSIVSAFGRRATLDSSRGIHPTVKKAKTMRRGATLEITVELLNFRVQIAIVSQPQIGVVRLSSLSGKATSLTAHDDKAKKQSAS